MSIGYGLLTALEIGVIMLIVWGFYNEDKLIRFEDKLAWLVASYIRKHRKNKYMKKHKKAIEHTNVRYISDTDLDKVVYNTSYDSVA